MKKYTKEDVDNLAKKVRKWGKWGENDQLGTLNYVTEKQRVEAAKEIRMGKVFSLAIYFGKSGPQTAGNIGRFNPLHYMIRSGVDPTYVAPNGATVDYADDVLILPLQCATQWDGLSHVFYHGKMWNGYDQKLVNSSGALKNDITVMRDKIVGRGVLLDVADYLGKNYMGPGEGISSSDLEATAKKQGVEIKEGDFVLIRTGQIEERLERGSWGDYAGGNAPGLTLDTVEWIDKHRVAAIASDTWGVEVRPNETDELYQPWHQIVIPNMGLLVGEIFYLGDLAKDCKKDGRYTFFFVAPPLPIEGAVGSPVNPIAIK